MKSAVTIFRRISLRKDREDIAISIVTKVEKNSRRRKDDGRRRVEKRKSLPLLSKNIFPRRGLETSKREKQKLSYNFVRQACVYFEQFGCVILLNNKQWEKRLRGRRGFTRFTGSEVFGKSAFFTLRLKSTN